MAVLAADPGLAQESPPPDLEEATAALVPSPAEETDKAPTSGLAETPAELVARTDTEPVAVMIKLDYDSAATYRGGVAGLEPTSPAVTGQDLSRTDPAVQAHDAYVAQQEADAVVAIRQAVPEVSFGRSYRLVYGGIAATVPANRVKDVVDVDGVVAVQADDLLQPLTDSSPEFLGAPTIYDELGGDANAGEGVIYGNLDTGLWPEHPSFEDQGNLGAPPARADGSARTCEFGDNPLTPAADVFACQSKLIGGEAFLDTYHAVLGDEGFPGLARDEDGHGTHTSSTAAGNIVVSATVLGIDRGRIAGLAPGAHVIEYRVCGPQGCFGSDSAAAVEEAILDGVDVINFSISGGTTPFTDPVELAFLDAYAAGVFVAASAGNEGPGASTVNHLSPWVTTVGASTQDRSFGSTLTLASSDGTILDLTGATITEGVDVATPVVLASAPPYSNPTCTTPAAPGTFTGVVVACERSPGRVVKGFNVLQGGAVGMILYNPSLAETLTDNHWLPTVHLAEGTELLSFLAGHPDVTATWGTGEAGAGQGDVMANFSSRGPAGSFIKPDVTAPGVQILAGHTPTPAEVSGGPPGEYYQAIAGTSMSSPHAAGSALLLAALHPDWTPGQIRSALMTTATTEVVKEDLLTPADPFDMGGGRIDLNVAGYAPLTFDETPARYVALGNDPVNAVHLNVPSINAPVMPGRLTTTRVATNVSGRRQRFTTSASVTDGTVTVLPRRFTLDPGESATITVTIESTQTETQQFGEVQIAASRGPTMHLPVAFVPTQGEVGLLQTCSPLTIPRQGTSTCDVTAQNGSFSDTLVDLTTTVSNNLRITGTEGAALLDDRTATFQNAVLAGAQPGVPSVAPGSSPAGYIPLDDFPGTLVVGVGDESVVNIDVPSFTFAGQQYATIGVTSNGYAVAGGATAEDVQFEPLGVADPARPNNVIAPFWTDLDGGGETGILANVLTDGTNSWLIIEWRVHVFGAPSEDRVFQLWLGIDGPEDISFTYSTAGDPGIPLAIGAENVDGSGGQYLAPPPAGDLRITSTDPTPGDSVSYTVFVQGLRSGIGRVTTSMDADVQAGTTVVQTDLRVLQGRAMSTRH